MSSPSRLPSLDGLRALAISLVLVSHTKATVGFPLAVSPRATEILDEWARMGVRLFFVLSGFLITSLLLEEEARTGRISLRAFWARRALRILPVYWLFLAAAFVLGRVWGAPITPATLGAAATFSWVWWPGTGSALLGHVWSLSVEEQFYLAWPLLLALGAPRVATALAGIVLFPLLRWWLGPERLGLHYYSIAGEGDTLLWGCLAALCVASWPALVGRVVTWRVSAMRALAFGTLFGVEPLLARVLPPEAATVVFISFQSMAAAFLVLSYSAAPHGAGYAFLNWAPIARLGVLSYSIYLWQGLLLHPPNLTWAHRFPQNLVLVFPIAIVSYVVVEKPFLRLRARWSKK